MIVAMLILFLLSFAVAITFGRLAAGRNRHDEAAYAEYLRKMREEE